MMVENGIPDDQCRAIVQGVEEILRIGRVQNRIKIHNFGHWRQEPWRQNMRLVEYQSLDWYLKQGWTKERLRQLNAGRILNVIRQEPWQQSSPHYDMVVVKQDLYYGGPEVNFIIGLAEYERSTIISTNRFLSLPRQQLIECLKTEAMHEIGHVFNLPRPGRTDDINHSLGRHCSNVCVMRQGLQVPGDWVKISRDCQRGYILCYRCAADLREYFGSG